MITNKENGTELPELEDLSHPESNVDGNKTTDSPSIARKVVLWFHSLVTDLLEAKADYETDRKTALGISNHPPDSSHDSHMDSY